MSPILDTPNPIPQRGHRLLAVSGQPIRPVRPRTVPSDWLALQHDGALTLVYTPQLSQPGYHTACTFLLDVLDFSNTENKMMLNLLIDS